MDFPAWTKAVCELPDCVIDGTQLGSNNYLTEIGSPTEALAFEYTASKPQIELPLAVGQSTLLSSRTSRCCQFVPVCPTPSRMIYSAITRQGSLAVLEHSITAMPNVR